MQGDSALGRVLALVRELRKRSPWNGAQTPHTLRPYLVEEVLELDHAIASGDPLQLREELGDMLLHLSFQIVLAEERSMFDTETVVRALEQKMRRRHAQLFGQGPAPATDTWERSKRREAGAPGCRPIFRRCSWRCGCRSGPPAWDSIGPMSADRWGKFARRWPSSRRWRRAGSAAA